MARFALKISSDGITAEEKVKASGKRYTYYHCTKKNKSEECHQGFLTSKALEDLTIPIDGKIFVTPDLSLIYTMQKTPVTESYALVAPRGIEPLLRG